MWRPGRVGSGILGGCPKRWGCSQYIHHPCNDVQNGWIFSTFQNSIKKLRKGIAIPQKMSIIITVVEIRSNHNKRILTSEKKFPKSQNSA